jgi:hypothetical protein
MFNKVIFFKMHRNNAVAKTFYIALGLFATHNTARNKGFEMWKRERQNMNLRLLLMSHGACNSRVRTKTMTKILRTGLTGLKHADRRRKSKTTYLKIK